MKKEDFTGQTKYQQILKEAKELKGKKFSDVIDKNNNYYVDLVQEGGGVLGIALVGYTSVLEAAGIRFFHLAGTSAGAINTLAMGGLGPINEAKSDLILEALAQKNLFDFVDGNANLKSILQRVIDGNPFRKEIFKLLLNIRTLKRALFNDLGLNPGKDFEDWLNGLLAEKGIHTIGQLKELRSKSNFPKGLIYEVTGKEIKDEEAHLHIITADVTTQSKVLFPRMAELYWGNDVDDQPPAKMARASMSVPFFFKPFEINNIPNWGKCATEEWKKLTNFNGTIPRKVKFVDGGMISNFPINVFHSKNMQVPRKPTFGVKLSTSREKASDVDDLGGFIGSMISTMRHDADNEFLINNPDFNHLICHIDADKEFNWLNFNMDPQKKKKLFILGAERGLEFIKKFDWVAYKEIRKKHESIPSAAVSG